MSHVGGSQIIISNSPAFYNDVVANVANPATVSGLWNFTVSPTVPDPTGGTQAANYEWVSGLTFSGTPVATTVAGGRIQIGTGLQTASSTPLGSATGNPYLALTTAIATSTYGNGSTSGLKAVITQNDGHIDSNFIRQSDNFSWSGTGLHTASTTFTATTTIAASSTATAPLILNGVAYAFPSTQSASSTVLANDGTGKLTPVSIFQNNYISSDTITYNAGIISKGQTGTSTSVFPPLATVAIVKFVLDVSGGSGSIPTQYGSSILFKTGATSSIESRTGQLSGVNAVTTIKITNTWGSSYITAKCDSTTSNGETCGMPTVYYYQ